jgi:hypothetical protein
VTSTAASDAALVERIMSTMDRINGKTIELQNAINGKMHWLPGPVQDKVIAGWNTFTGFMKECWDALYEIVTHMGSPSTLFATADSWSQHVGGPVSGEVESGDASYLTVDDNWDGTAAKAYRETLPKQTAALKKIKAVFTDSISTALSDMAKAIYVYWGVLIGALLTLIGGIIGAIGSTATIFGMPAAPFIAGAAATVAVGAFFTGGLILKSVASGVNTTLQQKINDKADLHHGHWPVAATI